MSAEIVLNQKGESAVMGFNPWVFEHTVSKIKGRLNPGDEVAVLDRTGQKVLAKGFFSPQKNISVKLFSWDATAQLNEAFMHQKLLECYDLRMRLGFDETKPFRLVHAEGDGLPGLIIDHYGGLCVVHISHMGIYKRRAWIETFLTKHLKPKHILFQTDRDEDAALPPSPKAELSHWTYLQQGLEMSFDPSDMQKTGAYLDQKENHLFVAGFSKHRHVWDLYCHNGGFGLHCARNEATHVLCVDRSDKALAQAQTTAQKNALKNISFLKEEMKDFLEKTHAQKPDLIVLDPPKLVTSYDIKEKALRHYFWLNEQAVKNLKPGGLLATFSCSGRVSSDEWKNLIVSVLRRNKRQGRFLKTLEASNDHPVNPHLVESGYLKGFLVQV